MSEETKRNISVVKDADGKMYLYDIIDIKKETSNSFSYNSLPDKNPFLNIKRITLFHFTVK